MVAKKTNNLNHLTPVMSLAIIAIGLVVIPFFAYQTSKKSSSAVTTSAARNRPLPTATPSPIP